MGTQHQTCSEIEKVESYILRRIQSPDDLIDVEFESHLLKCNECYKRYSELNSFYHHFFKQIDKPVYNQVFSLLHQIEGEKVVIAGILLKPQLLDEEPGKRHFTSEIVLSTDQSGSSNIEQIHQMSVNHDEILIRAVQSTRTKSTTLFLYAEDSKLYTNITFALPTLHIAFKSDRKGKVDIGQFDITSFEQLEVMIATEL